MKIYSVKRMTIPKIAVLATGITAAIFAATVASNPAQAFPSYAASCTNCHAAGGSVKATPSAVTVAPGAAYTVAIVITGTSTANSGYWISGNGASIVGNPTALKTKSANMTAPAAAGSYTYTVWTALGTPGNAGASSATYSITVGAVATTPPVTTPPVTTPPTTKPPVTTPPTTKPPVTTPPTTKPPVTTAPPTTKPPTATTKPPVTGDDDDDDDDESSDSSHR